MKKQHDEKMFNVKNIKKCLQIGVLGTALAANTMMFTNCAQSSGGKGFDCSNGHSVGCPHWKDVQTAPLGNGNYTMTCFMIYDDAKKPEEVETDVNNNLAAAESYIKGLVNGFSESLNDRPDTQAYFNDLITNVNKIDFTKQNDAGFDTNITDLRDACKPVINDIYNNIDDIVDKTQFKIYYKALANEVYRHGLGDRFGGTYGKNNTQEIYEETKCVTKDDECVGGLVYHWNYMYDNNPSYVQPFDFAHDLENGCQEITNHMDNLIEQAADNMGNGITVNDLRKVVNLSFNINSLDSMHDCYSSAKIYKNHSCDPIENEPILGY